MTQKPVLPPGTLIRVTVTSINGFPLPRRPILARVEYSFDYGSNFRWYRVMLDDPHGWNPPYLFLHDGEFEPVD